MDVVVKVQATDNTAEAFRFGDASEVVAADVAMYIYSALSACSLNNCSFLHIEVILCCAVLRLVKLFYTSIPRQAHSRVKFFCRTLIPIPTFKIPVQSQMEYRRMAFILVLLKLTSSISKLDK